MIFLASHPSAAAAVSVALVMVASVMIAVKPRYHSDLCALAATFSTAAAVPHPATRAFGIAGLAATGYACSDGNSTNGNRSIG